MIKLNLEAVILWITVLLLMGVCSCNEDPDSIEPQGKARYEDPPWLPGSSLKLLEDTVNYEIFIKLMDKANYREPIDKQLFTLFVPNDDAFKAYFAKIGKSGVDDLSEDEAVQLFTLHVLPNARSAYQLKYEYYWDELQSPQGEYASLFFRKGTNSTVIPYKELVRYHPTYKDKELTIYGEDRLVPLFSKDFFEDYFGALDGSDYTFLFPDSKWADNLNYHNAAVTDAEVRTSSGFIYFIDQVVGPMLSIEEYLMQNQDKFGIYYDIIQRFARYTDPKKRIEDNTLMYIKSYTQIENITDELGPRPEFPRYFKDIFSAYIPTDDVMQEYLDNTIYKYYETLDSVPEITLYYIAQSHLLRSMTLLSKIEKTFFNGFGDPIELSRNDIKWAFMASNGPVYAMNKVLEPNVFVTVPGRLFIDKNYTTFLFCMNAAEMLPVLSDNDNKVTLFAVSNKEMDAANIRYNEVNEMVQTRGEDGVWQNMNSEMLVEFLQDHIYMGDLNNLNGEGFLEMLSKNHIYYNNGKIQGGKNQELNNASAITSSEEEINGNLHIVDKAIRTRYTYGEMLLDDPDCSAFAELLITAGILNPNFVDPFTRDTIPNLMFIAEADYWTAFIPNNDAVNQAINDGIIPEETDKLRDFISYHFIRKNTIFDDGKKSGPFETNSIAETTAQGVVYNKLDISNSANNFSVTDLSGQRVTVEPSNANFLVSRGVVHKINAVLQK